MTDADPRSKSSLILACLAVLALTVAALALSAQTRTEACKHCRSTKDNSSLAWGRVELQTSYTPSPISRGCEHAWVPMTRD